MAARTNYFIGKDASRWQTGVANYERVRVEQVYPGIDVVYYGSGRQQLEYHFEVAPGADFKVIRLRLDGARSVRLDDTGDIQIETDIGTFHHRKPAAYQIISGARREVAARYVVTGRREVKFTIADYDKGLPLVIDPVLSYATYFGGRSGLDSLDAVAFDAAGNSYLAGSTSFSDLPTTPGAFQPVNHSTDVFVAKLNPAGTTALYVTYLGGSSFENGARIAVDGKGNAYVAGTTGSIDFPTTANALQTHAAASSSHAFVAKLNAGGTALVYSTYLGSPDDSATCAGLGVDAAGQVTIGCFDNSPHFPTTPDALQPAFGGSADAVVARLNVDGSALVYATYLGGEGYETLSGLALDPAGNTYVAGRTLSSNFPTTRHAYQRENKGGDDNFVAKISPAGNRLVYSTLLGGDFKMVNALAVDSNGAAYVTGHTLLPNLPTTPGALQGSIAGGSDAFVMKLNTTGSELEYSTFLGGSGNDLGSAIAVDSLGQAYVTGNTASADFPLMNPLQSRKLGGPLFRSTDGGNIWDDVPSLAFDIDSLAVDPRTSTLYAQTRSNIIKSTDGGPTWRVVASGIFGSLVIDPVRSGGLYAFTSKSIYKSIDAGTTWQLVELSIDNAHALTALVVDPKFPDTLYVSAQAIPGPGGFDVQALDATAGVAFKSTDGGASWTKVDFGLPVSSVVCLAIDPKVTSTIYAGTDPPGLLKSTDSGATWIRSGIFASRLVVHPINTGTLYAVGYGFGGILKSTNGGTSWDDAALVRGNLNLAIDPRTSTTLYVSNSGALNKTTDGGASWTIALNGIGVKAIALDAIDPLKVYTATFVTTDLFVARLNATGAALEYSTYLGGSRGDAASSIATDAYGNSYIGGVSHSPNFPVTFGAYKPFAEDFPSGFLIRIADPISPRITGVAIKGKKLFVSGEGFDRGAVITIDNVDSETQNDGTTPSVLLISKRGGKQIAPGQTVAIRVRDADGQLSDGFNFTRGPD